MKRPRSDVPVRAASVRAAAAAQQQRSSRLEVAGDGSLSRSEPGRRFPTSQLSPMSPGRMMIIGLLLNVFSHGSVQVSASLDCLVAEQGCIQEQSCMVLYRLLEYCAAEEAVSPLGPDARSECLEAQNSLQHYRPLQVCKCQRGSRREEHCLRVYWTVRFAAYDEYEVSPYEELQLNLVRNIEMSRMASIMAAQGNHLSRFADFQHNCQSSPLSASGCVRESRAMCLKAYAGLIGTIMTPNYVSNSSTEVSQWCTCDGSGNERQGCQRLLHMFSNNICLRNAISSMGISAPPPVENTPVPASQPSPHIHQETAHVSVNTLPEFNSVSALHFFTLTPYASVRHLLEAELEKRLTVYQIEDSEEEEQEQEEEESEEFNMIPPYSEKDSNIDSEARGSKRGAASRAAPVFPLLLLPTFILDWGLWSY
ncbi:hypothetical protein L3Q82_006472 [Scortum barcoo]|uniref:Uncharacterized protein n=1 Tax=Scortum barcoo TaxID=214431 RepID=A0ACB8WZJ0_9TELE|nr:hypothetical protein L3Q82_006472 [Scortum barcoo]